MKSSLNSLNFDLELLSSSLDNLVQLIQVKVFLFPNFISFFITCHYNELILLSKLLKQHRILKAFNYIWWVPTNDEGRTFQCSTLAIMRPYNFNLIINKTMISVKDEHLFIKWLEYH